MYENEIFPFQKETYDLIGIAYEIHNFLGKGFLEVVYKDAFEFELQKRGIKYVREKEYLINYKGYIYSHINFMQILLLMI